jgi:hypothetical protein
MRWIYIHLIAKIIKLLSHKIIIYEEHEKFVMFWRFLSSGICHLVIRRKSTGVSEEHVASIFRIKEQVNEEATAYFVLLSCLAYSWTLKIEAICFSIHRLPFTGLHGVISQKTGLFKCHRCESLKSITQFWPKNLNVRDNLRELDVDGRVILKIILKI